MVEPLYELQYIRESASNVSQVLLSADRGGDVGDSFARPHHMFTPLTPNIEAESEASSVRHSDIFQSDNPAARHDYRARSSHFMGGQGAEHGRLHSHQQADGPGKEPGAPSTTSRESFHFPDSVFTAQKEFSLYEQFNKGEKSRPLGPLYKVKALDEERQPSFPMLARVINFQKVQPQVVDAIFKEATALKALNNRFVLPIEGMCFTKKTSVMHIFQPQKISLYEYLHESGVSLNAEDKYIIAKNLARGFHQLHTSHQPPAHTHLSSKNIMLNPSDLHIYIGDYNMRTLKKFCKLFAKYQNHTQWSATEIWADPKADFYESPPVDVYSYGMILWELETGLVPFDGLDPREIRSKLVDEKMRPQIPMGTDKRLAFLIRRCWQDRAQQRPNFSNIEDYLLKVKFSD